MNEIIIFTDGASKGNPGPGGWGAVLVMQDKVIELGAHEEHTTNNRMELMGAIKAFEYLSKNFKNKTEQELTITVYADSVYVVNGITKWVHNWQKKGWINSQKDAVQNKDLWEQLLEYTEGIKNKINWKLISGHIGIAGNERVDEISSNLAENIPVNLFSGNLADYKVDILNFSHDENLKNQKAKSKSKSGSSARSKAKAYSYISSVNGVVKTHSTWAECEARVKGVAGTRFKKALGAAEEKEIIADFSKN